MPKHTVSIDGGEQEFDWPEDKVLLEALLDAGIDAPHSCTMGQCGACETHLSGGPSHMKNNEVLSSYDIADGETLACQTVRDGEGPYEVEYWF